MGHAGTGGDGGLDHMGHHFLTNVRSGLYRLGMTFAS